MQIYKIHYTRNYSKLASKTKYKRKQNDSSKNVYVRFCSQSIPGKMRVFMSVNTQTYIINVLPSFMCDAVGEQKRSCHSAATQFSFTMWHGSGGAAVHFSIEYPLFRIGGMYSIYAKLFYCALCEAANEMNYVRRRRINTINIIISLRSSLEHKEIYIFYSSIIITWHVPNS